MTRSIGQHVLLYTEQGAIRVTLDQETMFMRRNQARLRIEAPPEIKIFRGEIVRRSDDLPKWEAS